MEKIKRIIADSVESEKGKDILIITIVILVGLMSFELGRLSKNSPSEGIKIEYPDQTANVVSKVINQSPNVFATTTIKTKTFFASKRGKKYYSLGCSAGKTIKQENRIYFASREEAEKAGYQFSSSCSI